MEEQKYTQEQQAEEYKYVDKTYETILMYFNIYNKQIALSGLSFYDKSNNCHQSNHITQLEQQLVFKVMSSPIIANEREKNKDLKYYNDNTKIVSLMALCFLEINKHDILYIQYSKFVATRTNRLQIWMTESKEYYDKSPELVTDLYNRPISIEEKSQLLDSMIGPQMDLVLQSIKLAEDCLYRNDLKKSFCLRQIMHEKKLSNDILMHILTFFLPQEYCQKSLDIINDVDTIKKSSIKA